MDSRCEPGNEAVTFNARFSGTAMDVHVPVVSVLAIYAREDGQGMMSGEQDDTPPDQSSGSKLEVNKIPGAPAEVKRPNLKIVK